MNIRILAISAWYVPALKSLRSFRPVPFRPVPFRLGVYDLSVVCSSVRVRNRNYR